MKTCTSDQIKFVSWSDASAPKQYWNDISAIAMFISSALQEVVPPSNLSRSMRLIRSTRSTIKVQQHKEKFGEVRVYCEFAHKDLVKDLWLQHGNAPEPTQEFVKSCFVHDAVVYRDVYRQMVDLVPHYKNAIVQSADYPELLFDTKEELQAFLKRDTFDFYKKRYNCDDDQSLLDVLCKLCKFQ